MNKLEIPTKIASILDGILFSWTENPDSVLIVITRIHGNFYSNPFYYNFGCILNKGNIDFIYAQICDAFGRIKKANINTGKEEIIGSYNEDFKYTEQDIEAYINIAEKRNCQNIYLAHSLSANKNIYYLSRNYDSRIK